MEAQGGAASPDEANKVQKLLNSTTLGELPKEAYHHSRGEEDRVIPGHTPGLLHVTDRRRDFREPLSSVSSLEVHFDLLDLTELTDMSDQELTEVFVDSDEENPESPASHHYYPDRGSYLRSPSGTRCSSRLEQSHDRKHHSESDSTKSSYHKMERPKKP